ncbi:MAG: Asp23/Gls24 family envelope stress response protein [Bilifractor sp.]|jgi:uncharacterized alkaline shock family protein YloU
MADKNMVTIYDDKNKGTVAIAEDVLASIVGLAATEVEGVAALGGNITNEKIGHIRRKTIFRGVKVDVLEGVASVRAIIYIRYGYSIPDVTRQVQERVKSALENMTGLKVSDVNISVAEVVMDQAE